MALSPGTRVGPYEVTAQIGVGGMGEVYQATDTNLKRHVAIKVLPASVPGDTDRLARFQREAEVLAALNHPNIAQIFGLEKTPDFTALVMELVEGEDLSQRIARGAIPLDEALPIAKQIAEALEAAHERGIVHRDLKPANIKIRDDGTVKVLDFGLAKALEPVSATLSPDVTASPTITTPAMTRAGVILGTAAYMSPEQARGFSVDKRTDIWAFGCVLYEMLTGRRAFDGETTSDSIAAILGREPDWSALPPETPQGVRHLLTRCLEKNSRRRLRDIGDGAPDLDATDSRPAAPPPRTPSTAAARLAWSIAIVSLAALGIVTLSTTRSTRRGEPSIARVVRLTSGPGREYAPAISPDRKWVAYVAVGTAPNDRPDVWVKFIAGGDAINLTAGSDLDVTLTTGIGGLDISPDGTRVAVMARRRGSSSAFSTWELPAPLPGVPHKLLDDGLMGARWSPDGRRIAYIRAGSSAGDALWIADADGSNRREIIKANGGVHIHWPAWSSDGSVYFIRTRSTIANLDQADSYRIKVDGGAPEPVVRSERRAVFPLPSPDASGVFFAGDQQTADLSLWWQAAGHSTPVLLTRGVGDYSEPRISPDGSTMVATLSELRQALVVVPMTRDIPTNALTSSYTGDLDPTIAQGGDRVVFSSARSGTRLLWTARLDGTQARPLTSGNALDQWPALSPDGQTVAFVSDRGDRRGIWLVSAEGGTPRKLAAAESIGGLTWSRDGSRIVYAADAGDWPGLWSVTVSGGTIARVSTPDVATDPAWNPINDVIAYLSPTTSGVPLNRLRFVTADGKPAFPDAPTHPDIAGGFGNGLIAWSHDGRHVAVVSQNTNLPAAIWIVTPADPHAGIRKLVDVGPGPRIRGMAWLPDDSAVVVGKHDWTSDIVLIDIASH